MSLLLSTDTTCAWKKWVFTCYHQVGVKVQVSTLAPIDTKKEGTSHYCWVRWDLKLPTRPLPTTPWLRKRGVLHYCSPCALHWGNQCPQSGICFSTPFSYKHGIVLHTWPFKLHFHLIKYLGHPSRSIYRDIMHSFY